MYQPAQNRYDKMIYNRVGNSGLKLPAISLGLWHNFGEVDLFDNSRKMVQRAFDLGITHFDLANNYGPPPGSAEETFGKILKKDFLPYRDELIISSKAGYDMWPGPYGEWGSKKYLTASLDQSLKRMGLDYVDIFYSHRPDPETPFEETAQALDLMVRQGKALYIGISNYSAEQTAEIAAIFKDLKTPFIIHQPAYNMYNRWIEDGLQDVLTANKLGTIAFSPLAQGMLTDRYLHGIPEDSRAGRPSSPFLNAERVQETIEKSRALNEIAQRRGQTLAEMAVAWILRDGKVTSVLIGASRVSQIDDNVKALENLDFTNEELDEIEAVLAK
ncbi:MULTISPECIES: L-glyceraldehyde 3-phosphate reductase [Trichococcus]|jgi:L-glyceraldehyde 3-phosphate reductase|uniref:L-glyceraldehyde 3-phosphate reductase n=1 Tax=Trichococcus shcherbakoviae subsp. psychrophilus TaxID=2585775 RepID=A0A5C5E8T9_9LACT|nr:MULTISPECIES: L-glyceraldehyde 3-phosphate reductase [Trichococcus]OUL07786.1 L-glyceraldehyde 3-phosphate reductase [Sedimentibacter sp. SX930]TNV67924.1 L-glyceraldehyde 3-phosphate reductase [Trichococcus shcherbakoviae subsp. psychrophilus]TNV69569.1 L-glyceraldehyde 3-phosphate reductase [Trichococcus shcherbakoviae subsp. psychrophilus]CZR03034.1 potassium channel voltage-dependent beta subunit kcnab-related [Trichococcus sp. ES5]SHF72466.1 L-glyceraldehyde 3-phosphate reductase [Tric